jgi:hypothetical protein
MRFDFSKRTLISMAAVCAPVALAAGLLVTGTASARMTPKATTVTDWTTFYGYVDNSPPGTAIKHPGCPLPGGGTASHAEGKGTYADPITFAEVGANGPWCQIIYVPSLKKYFEHEDQCADSCGGQPKNHVDLWMGGDKNSVKNPEKKALLACENKWTKTVPVILNPPVTEPVDSTPLFTPPTTCHGGTGD